MGQKGTVRSALILLSSLTLDQSYLDSFGENGQWTANTTFVKEDIDGKYWHEITGVEHSELEFVDTLKTIVATFGLSGSLKSIDTKKIILVASESVCFKMYRECLKRFRLSRVMWLTEDTSLDNADSYDIIVSTPQLWQQFTIYITNLLIFVDSTNMRGISKVPYRSPLDSIRSKYTIFDPDCMI